MKKIWLLAIGLFICLPAYAHGISEADKASMVAGGYTEFVWLGAGHMLTGYDHLLFLFGVIFFLTKFLDVVKFVTAFTLGHTITLILATYMGITANYFLIDAVIALTVVYKGFDNLGGFRKYLDMQSPNLLLMVFLFGLIHGFGLSTRLQQLPLEGGSLLLKIISFNVGVELGQIAALTVMMALLATLRNTVFFAKFSGAANVGLMFVGMLLLLMQLHGYLHEAYVDEMPFSSDAHYHDHVKIEERAAPGISVPELQAPEPEVVPAPPEVHGHGDGKLHSH